MATIVFLLGARGAGKSSVLRHLNETTALKLKPSTTRERRVDEDDEYHFELNWEGEDLAWEIGIGVHRYGMRRSELSSIEAGSVAITVFDPGNIATLSEFREQTDFDTVTVGLDTIDTTETQHNRIGGDAERVVGAGELENQVAVVRECDVVFSGSIEAVADAVRAVCRLLGSRGGLVDGATIRSLVGGGALLGRADTRNIQSASYDLRLGTQAWCQGEFIELDEKNPSLRIPPYSYAIVTAMEEACVPRFIAGSYDLTVSGFMDGIILSNGPQVDPGYRGSLFCTLFNGSDVARGVTIGRHFATIQFFVTTRVTHGYVGKYQGRTTLRSFVSENTAISPGGNIVERIDELERSIDDKVAPVRQFGMLSLGILVAIHLAIAGWLWFGGPNLSAWLVKSADSEKQLEQSVSECGSSGEVGSGKCEPGVDEGRREGKSVSYRGEK